MPRLTWSARKVVMQAKTVTSGSTSVMIDHEPFMMSATINVVGGKTNLTLYVSTLVDWDSSMLDEVRKIVDTRCVRLTEKELHDDDQMYEGQAWEYQFLVFDECPEKLTHKCAALVST